MRDPAAPFINMDHREWDDITYAFPNFKSCTVEVWKLIINFIVHVILYIVIYIYTDDILKPILLNKIVRISMREPMLTQFTEAYMQH